MAMGRYSSNAGLIVACRTLGYLDDSMAILDPTYGKGTFWKEWTPPNLLASDLNPEKSPWHPGADFRRPPWTPGGFDAVVFDGPYKLNGTPTDEVDERYGVEVPARWQDRMALMEEGIDALVPLTRTWFLMKCQDQVVSQAKRWQTRIFADRIEGHGFTLVDMLHIEGYRTQPARKCPGCKGSGGSCILIHDGSEHSPRGLPECPVAGLFPMPRGREAPHPGALPGELFDDVGLSPQPGMRLPGGPLDISRGTP